MSDTLRPAGFEPFEQLANELAAAYTAGNEETVREINANLGTSFPTDFHDPEKMRQRVATWYASENRSPELAVLDARQMVVRARTDWEENHLTVRGPQTPKDWERILAVVREHGIARLDAAGITNEAMRTLSQTASVTHLNISGSKELTDEGAGHLAGMTQLVDLEIGGSNTTLTDRAFEPLRHLAKLRHFKSCWTAGLTDAGAAHLAACDRLENVNVMGSAAGDGLIRALAGKTALRFLETGRGITDAGIPHLYDIPAFKSWPGGDVRPGFMGALNVPTRLLIDGPFTDAGLGALAGLDGIADLSLFWHSKAFTPAGLAPLRRLPNLQVFGMDGSQCENESMRQIAAMPRLRQLNAQGAVADDAGWEALSQSRTLEYVWGRQCPNFSSRGFLALAAMPALRGMGIGCGLVEDSALAKLPHFPQLRQFVSIGVSDAGFRHVGKCENLESLFCMYCRDTGDAATEHIAGLRNLKTYYAGMTQITDYSLQILSRIASLEKLEFRQCEAITAAGIAHVAALPNLREIDIRNSPKVSPAVRQLFRETVRVRCSA